MNNHSKYHSFFSPHIPPEFLNYVVSIIEKNAVRFKISRPRKTKLGDFRPGRNGEMHQITVNRGMNPYSFLITTLHEFAHLIAHNNFGDKIQAHGIEWKKTYSKLIQPIIDSGDLPMDIEQSLLNSLINVKASSCSDVQLQRVLLKYEIQSKELITLEMIEKNSIFSLNNKVFIKGNLRRTRFLCQEKKSKREYLIHALAQVIEMKNE